MSKFKKGEIVYVCQLNTDHEKTGHKVEVEFVKYNRELNQFGERTADIVARKLRVPRVFTYEVRELEAKP